MTVSKRVRELGILAMVAAAAALVGADTARAAGINQDSNGVYRDTDAMSFRPGSAGYDSVNGVWNTGQRNVKSGIVPINPKNNKFGNTGFWRIDFPTGLPWDSNAKLLVPMGSLNITNLDVKTINVYGVKELGDYGTNTVTGDTIQNEMWLTDDLTWHNAPGIVGSAEDPDWGDKYHIRNNLMPVAGDGDWVNGKDLGGGVIGDPLQFFQGGEPGSSKDVIPEGSIPPPISVTNDYAGMDPDQAVFLGQVVVQKGVMEVGMLQNQALLDFLLADTNGTATFIMVENAFSNNNLIIQSHFSTSGDGSTVDGQGVGLVVPEPASLGLIALGGLALLRRRRA